MILLIAGHRGYIGKRLCDLLNQKHIKVLGISRNSKKFCVVWDNTKEVIVEGEFSQISEALSSLNVKIDGLINLAGETTKSHNISSVLGLCESNITLNALLASLALNLKIPKFIYTSTYSISVDGTKFTPQTLYAATKFAGGCLLEYYGIQKEMSVIRLYLYDIYGPNHHNNKLIQLLFDALISGNSIALSPGEQEISLLYVDDACDAIMYSLDFPVQGSPRDYTVMSQEILQVKDVPELVARALGVKWSIGQLKFDQPYRLNEIMTVKPLFPVLPGWNPSFDVNLGLLEMAKNYRGINA